MKALGSESRQRRLALIGAPTSAGAYSPGVEKAPAALRDSGLVDALSSVGIHVDDLGDIELFRWKSDRARPYAMNIEKVASAIEQLRKVCTEPFRNDELIVVVGGDCTVELGAVAAATDCSDNVGLIYFDLDADLNTPLTTHEGALDWMGVAHMLGIEGSVPEIALSSNRSPMLQPDCVYLLGYQNVQANELESIANLNIAGDPFESMVLDPVSAGVRAAKWGASFRKLLLHLDVDVLDFADMPLAENTRRRGLTYSQLLSVLSGIFTAPNIASFTIAEINPDHTDADTTLFRLSRDLAAVLSDAALWGTGRKI